MATMEAEGVLLEHRLKLERESEAREAAWLRAVEEIAETGGIDPKIVSKVAVTPAQLDRLDRDVRTFKERAEQREKARRVPELTATYTAAQKAWLDSVAETARIAEERKARDWRLKSEADRLASEMQEARAAFLQFCGLLPSETRKQLADLEAAKPKAQDAIAATRRALEEARRPIEQRVADLEAGVRAHVDECRHIPHDDRRTAEITRRAAPLDAEIARLRASTVQAETALAEQRLAAAEGLVLRIARQRDELVARVLGTDV
jgi:chromosome segregation ATPase